MMLRLFLLLCALAALSSMPSAAGEGSPDAVLLTETIGSEIDREEQVAYGLFPDAAGFETARIYPRSGGGYEIQIRMMREGRPSVRTKRISDETFSLLRLHVRMVEEGRATFRATRADSLRAWEADLLRRLILHYSAEKRYGIAAALAERLRVDHAGTEAGDWAGDLLPGLGLLQTSRKVPIWEGSLLDQSGRTEFLIFSGYYGVWLGIATPIALEARDVGPYAAGLIFGAPAALFAGHMITRNMEMDKGRATMIALGGHLGTWQGMGWADVAGAEATGIVASGVLTGLAGIGAAGVLTHHYGFQEGRAELISSALPWGIWFGFVAHEIADPEDGSPVQAMLIGSDALVVGVAFASKDVELSRTRVRLINLSGVIGTVAGFGVSLLGPREDGAKDVLAIAGGGSALGLLAGWLLTRDYDRDQVVRLGAGLDIERDATGPGLGPAAWLRPDPVRQGRIVPAFGVRLRF